MPSRKFAPFDAGTADLMRAAYHDACTVLHDCTDEERTAIVEQIIALVQAGERNKRTIARQALLNVLRDKAE